MMVKLNLTHTHCALANGVQAIVAHAPHLTRAHVSIAIAAGYLDEPLALPGLAHLLEHVLTTAPLADSPSSSLITWFAQRQGSLNARTDDHVTDIHFSVPIDALETAGLTAAIQLATPRIPLTVIRNEVAAIDAEWRARQQSSTMHNLAVIAALADPQHIGAGCRHGNSKTLGHDTVRLYEALVAFHRDHYHGGRVSIALLSPWATDSMIDLIQRMAVRFNPPPAHATALTIAPRWGRSRSAEAPATTPGITLLWPLPPTLSRTQFLALNQLADVLNQGLLVEQLPALLSDYCATAAPSGATDTFHVQLSGHVDTAQREALAATLNECLESLLAAKQSYDYSTWQPSADTVQLAPAWFAHARYQALARRFPVTFTVNSLTTNSARFLVPNASATSKHSAAATRATAYSNIQRWCGQYGVSDDFAALANTAWTACFMPNVMISLAPLATKRLARQGVILQQMQLAQGSWVMTLGSGAAPAMQTLLSAATLTATAPTNGLLAQQLLQRLTPLPDTLAMWVSHAAELDGVSQALTLLASRPIAQVSQEATPNAATHKTADVSTAIMRTLRLPGTPAQRWLLAFAEQRHSGAFFQQARYEHRLGYVAAVRRGDGAPCSLGYVVQTADNADAVATTLKTITDNLWPTFDVCQPPLPITPETPLAALITQWQSLLAGTTQPLHRLSHDTLRLTEHGYSVGAQGYWQTHWLDSSGRYWISD